VQHLRGFGRFEMNKRDLGRQREDRILVAEEEILHEIENQPRTSTRRLANHLGVSQFVVWLRVQNAAHEIRETRRINTGLSSPVVRMMINYQNNEGMVEIFCCDIDAIKRCYFNPLIRDLQ
jgi:hypothetical protein